MAEFDNDSFILIQVNNNNGTNSIEQQVMLNNAQLTQSILSNKSNKSNAGSTHSVDGWSEISAPSVKSNNSIQRKQAGFAGNALSVFSGTYLQHPTAMISGLQNNSTAHSDKGYYLVNAATNSLENAAVFSSNSATNDEGHSNNDNNMDNNMDNNNNNNNNNNNHSIGSIGSRVPFSWAEITKIQPQFHNENDKEVHKPKVFDSTPKIRTRYRAKNKTSNDDGNNNMNMNMNNNDNDKNENINDNNIAMPAIPESDPCATKGDLGRRVRRSGKRGSRLKYANHRRGTKRNWRKKTQK